MSGPTDFDEIFGGAQPSPEPRRKRRTWRKLLVGLVVVVVLAGLGVGAYVWNLGRKFDDAANQMTDEQVFGTPKAEKKGNTGGTNILLLGSDEPMKDVDLTSSHGLRSDSMMVMHLPEDSSSVQVMSIPRDSWVDIKGHGEAKINAALSYGGLPLAVSTVEDFIGTDIDHVAIIDFEGFKGLTDSLGGVTVQSEQAFTRKGFTFVKGANHLDGEQALAFVRERKQFKDGDFQRARNQQAFIKGLIRTMISADTLSQPTKVAKMVTDFAPYMYVDKGLSAQYISSTAFDMRDVRPGDIQFFTSPTAGVGRSADGQSIVNVDQDELKKVRAAFKDDTLEQYAKDAPESHL